MMAADVIQIGAVYVEEDLGSDLHGDMFYISFLGGAEGTQLSKLSINGDLNEPGFSLGDLFFDTEESGLGADHAYDFRIEQLDTANPNATVTHSVVDGTSLLELQFTNFVAGDLLVFSIDVDEVQFLDPNETDLTIKNDGFDPITSGVEFQNSLLSAEFIAPHYEDVSGSDKFLNRYDPAFAGTGLPLPADNFEGKRDRSAGAAFPLQQIEKPISLSGTVYQDRDEDLTLDATDRRLPGVTVELYELVSGEYRSTGHQRVTDAQGHYHFGTDLGLMPGTYQVRETQPAGYYSVGATVGQFASGGAVGATVAGNPDILTEVTIPKGDMHAQNLNFAENLPSSISGHVCVVTDGYDCFTNNSTKAPLAGVEVQLRDEAGTLVSTTTTDAAGYYEFTDLRSGTYTITQITPGGLIDGAARAGSEGGVVDGTSQITSVVLRGDTIAEDYDFCEITPAEISGHAFYDRNNNGNFESGEMPLANVLITLWNDAGDVVATQNTDSQGRYSFTNLKPGKYRITEVTPSEYLPGQSSVGTVRGQVVGTNDNTGDVIRDIMLPASASGINYDFGEILTGSISGRVITDINENCVIDAPGESPLSGVRIELLDASGNILETTFTDNNGFYRFENLLPGNYTVRETQPAGLFQGGQSAGSGGGDDTVVDRISNINLQPGADLVNYDFCEVPPSSLSGFVFNDQDRDCFFDTGESGIEGVTVLLIDASGTTIATTTTDANGRYAFTNLRRGQYTVREIQPAGFLQGGQMAGSGGGDDSRQDEISAINVGAGVDLVDYNFCEELPGSISGVVFADLDNDCVYDPGELRLEGVRVDLLDDSGSIIATTQTRADGTYGFDNIAPGQYSVVEHQPTGYFHGGQMAPAGNGDDSVADVISNITVDPGQAVTNADFCERPPAELSGYVFQDGPTIFTADGSVPEDRTEIRDGMRTSDDTPIAGVTIQLRIPTGAPALASQMALPGTYATEVIEVQTDANGFYHFTGLRPNGYHVTQIQPEGFVDSLDTPGSEGGISLNSQSDIDQFFETPAATTGIRQLGTQQLMDAVFYVVLQAGDNSVENNFSEIQTDTIPPPPPPPPPPTSERPSVEPPSFTALPPLTGSWGNWAPLPIVLGVGHSLPPTWHLSVINGGTPRGSRSGDPIDDATIQDNADRLDVSSWRVDGMQSSHWRSVSTRETPRMSRTIFDIPGSIPLTGDFNGDGRDEIALFLDGEWFIDLDGDGEWDESDIWLRLGTAGDQPVTGDWDLDGKDDVGIFGHRWLGDERAIAAEPGQPDPENMVRGRFKNVPPLPEDAPYEQRLLKRAKEAEARAHVIDHVFEFGDERDIAVSGDFNGDGIATVGTYRDGKWMLDVNGDGRINDKAGEKEFGQAGDLPLVGDFDNDGIDELAIQRGNQVIVDSNGNGRIDATDQVFELESTDGTVIVGDFDGNGFDEAVLHQTAEQQRILSAARQ
ncbi:MAG: hypothetical protein Aurels2KO_00960 [Aureliella sp.]